MTTASKTQRSHRSRGFRIASLGVVATVVGAIGATALNAAPAYAGPNDKLASVTIQVKTGGATGNDDKRRDSKIVLHVDTTVGTKNLLFSPASKHGGPGGSSDDVTPFKLDVGTFTTDMKLTVKPTQITGFRLEWTQGHKGWSNGDEWDFGGIFVTGHPANNTPDIDLLDAKGLNHHFNKDEILPLASFPSWSGSYDGQIFLPQAVGVHVDVSSFKGDVTGIFTLQSNAVINVCGQDFVLPANVPLDLEGTRTSVNDPMPGWMTYTLTKQFHFSKGGINVDPILTVIAQVSPDGSVVNLTVKLDNLPAYCGFSPFPGSLRPSDPAGN